MPHYRDIRLEMPDAEAMPFWAVGAGESDTEDLANWLRDMGEGVSEDPFDSSIDASWLGATPTAEDAYGNPIVDGGAAPEEPSTGAAEAGANSLRSQRGKFRQREGSGGDTADGCRQGATSGSGAPGSGNYRLTDLRALEAQAIHIFREVAAEFERPTLMFSGGKDSIVMLHVAKKAFWPAPVPFPVLHVDTGRNFGEVLEFRDRHAAEVGVRVVVAKVQDDIDAGRTVEDTTPGATRNRLQTPTLLRAISEGRHDAVFGGARRDEEKARAKERIFSFRDEFGQWDPKSQRPELWNLYNGATTRVSTSGSSRSPTGPSSTCGATSATRASTCPPSTTPTAGRCSSATACSWPSPGTWPRATASRRSRRWCASARWVTPTAPAASSPAPRRSTWSSPRWRAPG